MNKLAKPTPRGRRALAATALGLCLGLLAGCAVGPDFQPPQVETPAKWSAEQAGAPQGGQSVDLTAWWRAFDDPLLESLIQRAVAANPDLKLAEARVRQAMAQRGVSLAALGPSLDASGSYSRGQSRTSSGGQYAGSNIGDQYVAGFDASWELDIFGGARRGLESADAQIRANVEDRRDVLVTLTAEVASNYLALRTTQQRIDVAQNNLAAQQRTAQITIKRHQAGFANGLESAQAQAQVASTAAQIPTLEATARQTMHNIAILLGQPPADLVAELSAAAPAPPTPPAPPLGLPADLLRRRPDIRRAEAEIHVATANIGVATAELFPKINIIGSSGYSASQAASWFTPANLIWSFGPSVSWNLFGSGRTKAQIEVQKMLEEQTVIAYRQTVLAAMREVEDALIASGKEAQRRVLLAQAVQANQKAVALSLELYTQGHGDFLSVLEAQRSLYSAQDSLAQSAGGAATDMVALYKALGGGWRENDADDGRQAKAKDEANAAAQ